MARFTYGSKPANNPVGAGWTNGGVIRGTTRASRPKAWWLVKLGGRVGDQVSGGPNPDVSFHAYAANVSTWVPGAMLAETAAATITTFGNGSFGGATGTNIELAVTTPALVTPGQPVTLAAYGEGGNWSHGQDLSGAIMHQRTSLTDAPDPFSPSSSTPQGVMSLWAIGYDNTAPWIPIETVSPPSGGATTDTTPTIGIDFRDNEEALEGFTYGDLDMIGKYQIQVWDDAGTTLVEDSGQLTASGGQQSARRATWTAATLTSAWYTARARVWDLAGEPSPWQVWRFQVNASSMDADLAAGDVAIASPLRTTSVTPGVTYTWHHGSATAMTDAEYRIRQQDTDTVVRDPYQFAGALADGASTTFGGVTLFALASWGDLPRGKTYRYEVRGTTDGVTWSGWAPSAWFIVDKAPNTPFDHDPPAGRAFASLPVLSITATDDDDDSSDLSVSFKVRPYGSGSGTVVSGTPQYLGNNRWGIQSTTSEFTGLGNYEWAAVATDPAGLTGTQTAWTAVYYTSVPDIDFTLPAAPEDTITTGTPTLAWTVDRTQISYRLRLYRMSYTSWLAALLVEALGGSPFIRPPVDHDSGTIVSGTGAYAVPSGTLRNTIDYTMVLDVNTSDGLTTEVLTGFTLTYTPPDSVTSVAATPTVADFDVAGMPTQIVITHDAVTTDEPEFDSYVYRRTDLGSGETITLGLNTTLDATSWIDETALSGRTYEYSVQQRVWEDLDLLESNPATDEASITVRGVVMTVVAGGEGRVALRYFNRQQVTLQRDKIVRKSWAARGRVMTGPADGKRWRLVARIFQEDGASFTPDDILEAIAALGQPSTDPDGALIPKVVCVRDDLANLGFYTVLNTSWDRNSRGTVFEVDIDLQEIAWSGGAA